MLELADLFQDYAPPNAADYLPDALVSPKLWPRVTLGWSIAYNSAAGEEPAEDLDGPHQAGIRATSRSARWSRPSGGTTWTRIMFERQVLGEDYWEKQAATRLALYPSGAPRPTRWCAARSRSRRCSTTSSTPRSATARRSRSFFPPEGVPVNPYAERRPEDRGKSPNAAKLFLNWCLVGGRPDLHDQGARQPHLAEGRRRSIPEGFDPKVVKVWVPNFEQFEKLRAGWVEEWNKIYGYRQ